MKLKGLLKLVTGLVVIIPTSLSVVACNTATVTKNDLKTITQLSGVNFSLDTNKKYSAFDSVISTATEFSTHPIPNCTVKYYDAAAAGNDITDSNQAAGTVYVVITAASTDPYWTGDTTRIAVTINDNNKVNLSTITSLSGLTITVSTNKKYSDLNNQIATATEFSTHPMQDCTVKYYDAAAAGTEITTTNQVAGTVYVVIIAHSTDPYWTGATSDTTRIAVTINKVNLSTITSLSGLTITVSTNKKYSDLNDQIATATEFTANPIKNFTIKYYDAAAAGTEITTNQAVGTVYVVITADSTDPYWTGATSDTTRIAVTINKVNLSTITSLSGLTITVTSNKKYSDLNAQIATATEFTANPIKNFTIKYYDAAAAGAEITTTNQAVGTVYVVITAASTDPYWTGATSDTTRIAVTINKVNLSTITSLNGLIITVTSNKKYSDLNAQIAKATEFTVNPIQNFTIKYYDAAAAGAEITTTNQVAGTVYVVITADSTDPYWEAGDTTRIAVIIS